MADDDWIFDATEATFEQRVVQRSHQVPVLVDFWAQWCGPCRYLGPILEDIVEDFAGQVLLAKIDTDRNLNLAQRYRIQTIPNVKAFSRGTVVNEFVGALPEPAIRQFIQGLIPTQADVLAEAGAALEKDGRWEDALNTYCEALGHDPRHPDAAAGEFRALVHFARWAEATSAYDRMPGPVQFRDDVVAGKARIDLATAESGTPALAELEALVAGHPDDLEARFHLAGRHAAAQRYREALETYLVVLERDRRFRDGAARKMMIQIFDIVGQRSALADEFREKLAGVLY